MKNKLSIIMSIYNETESQIRESVYSILNQTFQDFEFIIVVDNPRRNDIESLLKGLNDSRIVLLQNETNMGLAMCMNKAASETHCDVLARMDADDVAMPNRLELEYETLIKEDVDLVFSNFIYIDENSATNGRKHIFPKNIRGHVPSKEIALAPDLIHHPTVIMRKQMFEKVGGYRDFPCTQDVDLWMRMQEAGAKYFLIDEPLLKYRVNPNGTTAKKPFKQYLTGVYIYSLSIERLLYGYDSFSLQHYNNFLLKNGLGQRTSESLFQMGIYYLRKAARAPKMSCMFYRLLAFLLSPQHRKSYMNRRKKRKIINSFVI